MIRRMAYTDAKYTNLSFTSNLALDESIVIDGNAEPLIILKDQAQFRLASNG